MGKQRASGHSFISHGSRPGLETCNGDSAVLPQLLYIDGHSVFYASGIFGYSIAGRKENLVPALSLFNITLNVAQAIGFLLLGRLILSIFSPFTLPLGFTSVRIVPQDMLFVVITLSYLTCTLLILAIPHNRLRSLLTSEQRLPRSPGKEMWAIVQRDVKGSWQVVRKDKPLYVALLRVSVI